MLSKLPNTIQDFSKEEILENKKFLASLSKGFPNIQAASTEIINLKAILQLPKGTEHFITDVHGSDIIFNHILRNASGVIKRRIEDTFGNEMRTKEKAALATLIYYPSEKIKYVEEQESNMNEWYLISLQRLVRIARVSASKYTRSKVRKAMPKDYAYIIDELLNEQHDKNKNEYFKEIIKSIIEIGRAKPFIEAICHFIHRLTIDKLHVVGDIYDRGPHPEKVMDRIEKHHDVDIQWGNHDVIWMGAAAGMRVYIATVLRICARYNNLDTVEEAYGINIRPLQTFAMNHYAEDACELFTPKGDYHLDSNVELVKKMHKAISIIQFKLEAEIIQRNPQFDMDDRLLLNAIDYDKGTITVDGMAYDMLDMNFPTIDPKNPNALTAEEEALMSGLQYSFKNSERLQNHIKIMYSKGSMYLKCNDNLLYHACIPMTAEGGFQALKIGNKMYKGKAMLDKFDSMARRAYISSPLHDNQMDRDYLWYLWCGPLSPLFGKKKMATLERYFVADKTPHKEVKDPYFSYREKEEACKMILQEFGLNPEEAHIVNGHVPVKDGEGEKAMKANGKMFVIDGGMSPAYHSKTGVQGFTLIYNSFGLILVAHDKIASVEDIIKNDLDMSSETRAKEHKVVRKRVADTDNGVKLRGEIRDLEMLLAAYRKGLIIENYHVKDAPKAQ